MNRSGLFFGVAAIAWSLLLLYLHFLPAHEIQVEGWYLKYHFDKVAHMIMFAVMFVLWFRFFRLNQTLKKTIILAGVIVLIYGAVLEILQGTVVVGRTTDLLDFLADSVGILVGFAIIKIFSWDQLVR